MALPGYEWLREQLESEKGRTRLAQIRELQRIADGAGISLTHLALAWCLRNPRVSTVILGASRLSQLQDNLAALDAVEKLTPDVMEAIEGVVRNKPEAPRRFT